MFSLIGENFRNALVLSKGRSGFMVCWNAESFEGMQRYPQQLSLFSEDQHEVQRVQGAGSMMCYGNL